MKRTLLAFAALLTVACSSAPDDGSTPPQPGETSAKLHEGTIVVPQSFADVARVSADRVEFPATVKTALKGLKPGAIMVSNRATTGTQNPEGFLRRVKSIDTSVDVVVMTEEASLPEAFDELKLESTLSEDPNGTSFQGTGGTKVKLLDFSGTKLLDVTESLTLPNTKTIGYRAFATVEKGTLTFSPTYDIDADISFLKVKSFHVIGKGQLDAELLLDVGVELKTTLDSQSFTELVAKEIFKAPTSKVIDTNVSFGTIDLGIVKLPSSAHFTATIACDIAYGGGTEVKFGGKASGSITAGLKYENGKLSPVYGTSSSIVPTAPAWTLDGVARARCSITPRFELKLFGVATGWLEASAYAGIGGNMTCGGTDGSGNKLALVHGDADAGVSAKVGAKVNVFGLFKWQKECSLFDTNGLAQYDTSFALPGGSSATCTPASNYSLPPQPAAQPEACFGDEAAGDAGSEAGPIPGTCTHDTCTAGAPLGQACDACTDKVCGIDPYCCTTYWGYSCFATVEKVCGKKCQ